MPQVCHTSRDLGSISTGAVADFPEQLVAAAVPPIVFRIIDDDVVILGRQRLFHEWLVDPCAVQLLKKPNRHL
jgi:hypothetical protein